MSLFKQIFIWKKIDADSAVRYCCFENLEKNNFCVQNADFFSLPIEWKYLQEAEARIAELFMECAPDKRCEWHDSLKSAIEAHDSDFSGS